VWRVDLETGDAELIVSIAEIAALRYPHGELSGTTHWFNHLLVDPAGDRFVFLHRWFSQERRFATRMLTARLDGSDVCVVEDSGVVSHFIWRDPGHILMFAGPVDGERAFYLYDARTGARELVLDERRDGHCVYLPGGEWIMSDTYPQPPARAQELYLYRPSTHERRSLGEFPSPPGYTGEWRCDLHARFSRDGKKICFDSAHELGRQLYVLEL
jgi:hypothetical protein